MSHHQIDALSQELDAILEPTGTASHPRDSADDDKQQHINTNKQAAEFKRTLAVLKAFFTYKKKQLAAYDTTCRGLRASWHNGSLSFISARKFESLIMDVEKKIGACRLDFVAMNLSKYQICGRIMDDQVWDRRQPHLISYLESLVAQYKPSQEKMVRIMRSSRSDDDHAEFQKDVRRAYIADGIDEHDKGGWCVIQGHYVPSVTAIHLVPLNIGDVAARHLFGKPSNRNHGHLMRPDNSLPISSIFSVLFNSAMITIIPTEEGQLQVVVLDQELTKSKCNNWHGLHGTILKFHPNSNIRPAMKNLFFSFCINVMRRQRSQKSGWWHERVDLQPVGKDWGLPREYARKSTMEKLINKIGHVNEAVAPATLQRASTLWPPYHSKSGELTLTDFDKHDDYDDLMADVITLACIPAQWNQQHHINNGKDNQGDDVSSLGPEDEISSDDTMMQSY